MRRDTRFHVSVRIARSRVAALAKNAAFYSSVANIGCYQVGSGPAEQTSETILTIARLSVGSLRVLLRLIEARV